MFTMHYKLVKDKWVECHLRVLCCSHLHVMAKLSEFIKQTIIKDLYLDIPKQVECLVYSAFIFFIFYGKMSQVTKCMTFKFLVDVA